MFSRAACLLTKESRQHFQHSGMEEPSCRGYSPPQSPRADSWVMASALAGIHGTLVFGETNCPRAVFLPLVMRLQIIFPLSSGNKGPFLHFLIDLYMMC